MGFRVVVAGGTGQVGSAMVRAGLARGEPVHGASCIGIGQGGAQSRIRCARIMGEKEDAVRSVGFARLAIFRPGIITGNMHTPGWPAFLGRFVPGPYRTIDQEAIGRAFVGEFLRGRDGTTILDNAAIRRAEGTALRR